jgi:hypothetical protein
MNAATWQAEFADALLATDAAPAWLAPADAARFPVYRNNVFHGLTEALGEAYPAVRRLVGDDFFRAMAARFVQVAPPRARSLVLYGDGFAAFTADFPPAAGLPYLPDVARLERAWLESLHAADAAPLDPTALALLGESLASARFVAHPATRLVESLFPIVSIWQASRDDTRAGPIDIVDRPEAALVCRARDTVTVRALAAAPAAFAAGLLSGQDGATAATAAGNGLDVADTFRCLLADGAFSAVADT